MVVKKKSTKKVAKRKPTPVRKVAKTAKKPSKIVKKVTKRYPASGGATIKKAKKAVKKTAPKKTTTKRAPIKKTSNRGRPKKEFKLKHKRISEQQTPKVETKKITIHKMPRSHRIKRSGNTKDRSILYLFVFSIILFAFSLGVSFFKKNQAQELKNMDDTTDITTTQIEGQIETITEINAGLDTFYIAINSKNFTEAYEQLDNYLRRTSTIKTYFSSKRLTRFLDNLQDGKIHISNIQEEIINDYTTKITYNISYTLLDESRFEEQWTVNIVKKDGNEGKIAAIKCETKGCSRMPFFNPNKYNIK